MLYSVVFVEGARRDEAGFPGSTGTTWGLAAAVCRVGVWPEGLSKKSNNPNLSGGEKLRHAAGRQDDEDEVDDEVE